MNINGFDFLILLAYIKLKVAINEKSNRKKYIAINFHHHSLHIKSLKKIIHGIMKSYSFYNVD